MEQKYLVIILVILLAYGVTWYNERTTGAAVFNDNMIYDGAARDFAEEINEKGGDIVPFPTPDGTLTPEEAAALQEQHLAQQFIEQSQTYIEKLFEQAAPTLSISEEANEFMVAIRRLSTNSQDKATSAAKATDIAKLFKQRIDNSGIILSQNANGLMQKITLGGR